MSKRVQTPDQRQAMRWERINGFFALPKQRWLVGSESLDGEDEDENGRLLEIPVSHQRAGLPSSELALIAQRLGPAGTSVHRLYQRLGQSEWFIDARNNESMLTLVPPSRWGELERESGFRPAAWAIEPDSPMRHCIVIGISSATGGLLAVIAKGEHAGHVVWIDQDQGQVKRLAASLEDVVYGLVHQPMIWAARLGLTLAVDAEGGRSQPMRFLSGSEQPDVEAPSPWYLSVSYQEHDDWSHERVMRLRPMDDVLASAARIRTRSGTMAIATEIDPFGTAEISCHGRRQPLVTAIGPVPLALSVMLRDHSALTASLILPGAPYWRR